MRRCDKHSDILIPCQYCTELENEKKELVRAILKELPQEAIFHAYMTKDRYPRGWNDYRNKSIEIISKRL